MAPRLSRQRVIRLERLLHMRYKPAEIADELGVTVDTVYRSYLPAGAPVEVDGAGKVWIVGDLFAQWARKTIAQKHCKPRGLMADGEGYCLRCNQVVVMEKARVKGVNERGVGLISGKCPGCGGKVNRFQARLEARG